MAPDYDAQVALPKLRALDIFPIDHDGKPMFVVRDNEGVIEQQLLLPPLAFVVGCLLSEAADLSELRLRIAEKFQGTLVSLEELQAVLHDLDQHYLLESDRLAQRRGELLADFASSPNRPARFAGLSYASSSVQLSVDLEGFYTAEGGAGRPISSSSGDGIRAVVAPHIDFARGGTCYTHAYRQVAERSQADVYVILGVAHVSPTNPLVLSAKNYETPLGTIEADRAIVDELAKRIPSCFEDEIAHRTEHSAEFQAVFLKHARPHARFTIVPILCSAFEVHCENRSPSTAPRIEEFLQALGEVLRSSEKSVCLVAGVDYAHVGPRFGDPVELNQALIDWMVAEDNKSLACLTKGDAEGFWSSVVADGNRRHVCGLSATYSMLRLLGSQAGTLLKYGYAPDPAGGIVSFASAVF